MRLYSFPIVKIQFKILQENSATLHTQKAFYIATLFAWLLRAVNKQNFKNLLLGNGQNHLRYFCKSLCTCKITMLFMSGKGIIENFALNLLKYHYLKQSFLKNKKLRTHALQSLFV